MGRYLSTVVDGFNKVWYNDSAFLLEDRKVDKKTGAGGKPQDFDTEDGQYVKDSGKGYNSQSDIQPLKRPYKADLTKQELAMFYERIGKIKKEGHYVPKTAKGDMLIQIQAKDSNVLVIASGTYLNPKIKYAIRFEHNDEMFKIVEALEDI